MSGLTMKATLDVDILEYKFVKKGYRDKRPFTVVEDKKKIAEYKAMMIRLTRQLERQLATLRREKYSKSKPVIVRIVVDQASGDVDELHANLYGRSKRTGVPMGDQWLRAPGGYVPPRA